MRALALVITALLASAHPFALKANPVIDWNALMLEGIREDNSSPPLSTRNLAILHTAIFDAVNSISPTHQAYRIQLAAPREAVIDAAVNACAYFVVGSLYPTVRGRAEQQYQSFVDANAGAANLTMSLEFGSEIARLTLESRSGDGSSTDVAYFPSDAPGEWRRTPPYFRPPLAPNWRYVRPFCIEEVDAFVPGPPPDLGSAEYAEAFNEVHTLGGEASDLRTEEQSLIAVFWSDYNYTSMPPGHWHEIASTIATDRELSVTETARLFALISLAQADAAIVCWEAKYRYNLWRPVTAIQRADEDGNVATVGDVTWSHYIESPPFPAYPSGHSTFSTASAKVITKFFGTDTISFVASSDAVPGVYRSFDSLTACANEVGLSRIYGGIHFSFDNTEGKTSGRAVGDFVAANYLLELSDLPRLQIEERMPGITRLRAHGRLGHQLIIEKSSDLLTWNRLESGGAVSGGLLIVDEDAGFAGFYRVYEE